GRAGILVVAAEYVRAAREDLAVGVEPKLDRRQRLADGIEAERVGAVERQRRRGFGEPVAFDDQDAVLVQELLDLDLEPGAAGQTEAQAAAGDAAHRVRRIASGLDR